MSRKAPEGWRAMPFSEAIAINPMRRLPRAGLVPFLDMASLPFNGADVSVLKAREVGSGGSKFQSGDTLFARITPCAENGKLGFVRSIDGGEVAQGSTEFIVMAARDGLTLPEYVRYLAGWSEVRDQAIGLMEGTSGRQRVPNWSFDEIEVLIPPLDEQRRITEVLRSVDEVVDIQEKVCNQLLTAFTSALETCFTAADWPAYPLGDLCESIQVGIVVRPASYYVDCGGIPALRSLNVLENRLALDDLVYISEAGHATNHKSSLRAGDVVTRRTGEPGKTAMIPVGFEGGLNCIDIIFSRPKNCLRSAYFSFFMNSDAAKRQVAGLQGGLAQQHLNVGEMKKLRVPLPDLQTQDRTVAVLADMWTSMEASRHTLQHLTNLAASLSSDLLSGRVRVPALITTAAPTRAVQPAFKRAVFAAEVVHQLHRDDRFGSVKHEKIVHLCELHLGLQGDLDRHAYKEAAGPYDPSARRSVERIFRQQKWFNPEKQDRRVVYQPLEATGGHSQYFDRYFGTHKTEIQRIIDLLRRLTTQQCEIVATLYAVWNDFLIDGRQPSDDEIVHGVLTNWTDSKRQIPEEKWRAALPWMRQRNLIPVGRGEKTRVAAK